MYKIDSNNNITIVRGDYLSLTLELFDEEGEPYTPQTGDSIRFAVAEEWGNTRKTDCLIYKTIDTSSMVIEITASDTKKLDFGTYKYDIEFTDAYGHPDTIIRGTFTVSEEVY